jgi:uncharacterized RmlC-like cupin family protein
VRSHLNDRCVLLNAGERYTTKQGHTALRGITRESVGALKLGMHVVEIPPGGRALPHLHPKHESAIYLIEGTVEVWHGNDLHEYFVMQPGDMAYIPPGVPHLPINSSQTEMAIALVVRTDPNEDEAVALLPTPDHVTVQMLSDHH